MLLVASIIILLFLSAFFSGTETAVMALDRYQVRTLAEEGDRHAKKLQMYLDDPERFFSVVLLGNTFANLACASLFTLWIVDVWGEASVFGATIMLTIWVLLFCELMPKSLAARYPLAISMVVVHVINAIEWLLSPILFLVHRFAKLISNRKQTKKLSMKDLRRVIRAASSSLSGLEQDMLEGVLDLSTLSVESVMLPKHLMDVLDLSQSDESIEKVLKRCQSHYLLVVSNHRWDDVLGVVYLKDLMQQGAYTESAVRHVLKKVGFVQEGTQLNKQFASFQKKHLEVSVVVDEYGAIIGVLDVHDIVEEVVGYYANRRAIPIGSVRFDGSKGYWIRADVKIRDLNKYLDWHLPEDKGSTIAGLVTHSIKGIPDGDCSLMIGKYLVELVEMRGNRLILFHICEILNE